MLRFASTLFTAAACLSAAPCPQDPLPLRRSTRVAVAPDGVAAECRVLIASCPPLGTPTSSGWRLEHDGSTSDGVVTAMLDRRRAHVAWAVEQGRGLASDLVPVVAGGEATIRLQPRVLQRIDVQVDAGWLKGDGAPTQLLAFDLRMPGISFPAPLPGTGHGAIAVPPLPVAMRESKKGAPDVRVGDAGA